MRLEGKVAVITGGASGIGAASARRFVNEGCRAVLGDIQQAKGDVLLKELGDAAVFALCDVTKEEDVASLVDLAVDRFGRLDIMFNNAGIVGAVGPIDTAVAAEWSATLDILLNGVFYGMKHAARVMKPQGYGSIISMATEMVASVLTGDPEDIAAAAVKLAAASPLLDRAGTAEDVANAALWLASDESGYTNGHILTTDAGMTTGSTVEGPGFAEYEPMIREAGKSGL
jgi:NAD(P)-dependent dehydrogenase (short-subunit alcohol dehydrogenase family)